MDPVEVREERVATGGAPGYAAPPGTVAPGTAPAAGASYYRSGVYPVGYRAVQLIWLIVGVVNAILALDFIFRAAGAHDTGFVSFIEGIGAALAAPFDGIFNNVVANGRYMLRWSDLVAIAIYSLIAWGVTKLVRIIATSDRGTPAAY